MDDFLAGFAGGCAGVIVGYPLDTVKVRIQTQDPSNLRYTGTLQCLRSIIRKEGASALFKGMTSPMAGVAGINAIIFGVYGNVQKQLSDPDCIRSIATAGVCAGLAQAVVTSPMEMVKTRLQVQSQMAGAEISNGPFDCLRRIWKANGLRGVFQGFGITCIREFPAFAIYFSSYELMTRQADSSKPLSTWTMLYAGGMAGVYSWAFTYPIDMIKSRLQVDGLCGKPQYTGIADCVRKSYQAEGISVFFRGLSATILRAFPTNAATFAVVTWTLRFIRSEREAKAPETALIALKAAPLFGVAAMFEDPMLQFSRNLFRQYALIEPLESRLQNNNASKRVFCESNTPPDNFVKYCEVDDSDDIIYSVPTSDEVKDNFRSDQTTFNPFEVSVLLRGQINNDLTSSLRKTNHQGVMFYHFFGLQVARGCRKNTTLVIPWCAVEGRKRFQGMASTSSRRKVRSEDLQQIFETFGSDSELSDLSDLDDDSSDPSYQVDDILEDNGDTADNDESSEHIDDAIEAVVVASRNRLGLTTRQTLADSDYEMIGSTNAKKKKTDYHWIRRPFVHDAVEFHGLTEDLDGEPLSGIEYFLQYFSPDFIRSNRSQEPKVDTENFPAYA